MKTKLMFFLFFLLCNKLIAQSAITTERINGQELIASAESSNYRISEATFLNTTSSSFPYNFKNDETLFRQRRRFTLVGGIVLLGSGGLTSMLGLVASSDKHQAPNPNPNYPSKSNNSDYYIVGAGVVMMAASIPLFMLSKKYKSKYKNSKASYGFSLKRRFGDIYASDLQPTLSFRLGM